MKKMQLVNGENVGAALVSAHKYHKQNLHYPWAAAWAAPTLGTWYFQL